MHTRQTARGWHAAAWLALAGLALAGVPAQAQLLIPSDAAEAAKPITVAADQGLNWVEGDQEIFLFRGNVVVEQGLVRARMQEAVIWLDKTRAERGQALPVRVYGEGEVVVDRPPENRATPDRVFLDLQTTNDFRLRNASRQRQSGANDPLYRRAVAARQATLAPATGGATPGVPQAAAIRRVAVADPDAKGPAVAATPQPAPTAPVRPKARTVQEVLPRPVPDGPPPPVPGPGGFLQGGRATTIQFLQRGTSTFDVQIHQNTPEEKITLINGGVTLFITEENGTGVVDISTDRAVVWTRNVDGSKIAPGLGGPAPTVTADGAKDQHVEVYLEGHVEIRQATTRGPEAGLTKLLLADQAYYDVTRNVALLLNAELITRPFKAPAEIHLRAQEIRGTSKTRFEASNATIFSSRLPSDPDLTIQMAEATFEERRIPAKGLFGRPLFDPLGRPREINQLWFTGEDTTFNLLGVPFFYLPHAEDDARNPTGPLDNVRFRTDRIFGTGLLVDWDLFQLLGANTHPDNTRWKLQTDYLSARGPGLGTVFTTHGWDLFDLPGRYDTLARAYVMYDGGTDFLGGPREFDPPRDLRGRTLLRHYQEIGEDVTFQGQFAYLSDRNFLEQYYKNEFDTDYNQETFLYLKKQHDNYAGTLLLEPRLRWWVTETQWLPRADGAWLGESFFDRFTYYARASAGYASQRVTSDVNDAFINTPIPDQFDRIRQLPPSTDFPHYRGIDTARIDLWQELDMPFEAGPFKVVPYGLFDVTYYSRTLADDNVARLYGGGGVRASIPFTRIYEDVNSQLFNVHGLAHKIVFEADYRYVQASKDFRTLPELDRINDDATDQALRDIRTYRLAPPPGTVPGPNDIFLATSPIFDPQLYAIRRGLMHYPDTQDDVQFLRLSVDQRWQTKRGFPGHEHIIDWMTLNTSLFLYPDASRDNFGKTVGMMEYDYTWHIGDRTTFMSSGWLDPGQDRARSFSAGLYLDRDDRTNFYLGYRSIEPLQVDAVIVSTTYVFSPKWRATLATTYDFGNTGNLGNTLVLSRIGSDLQLNIGFTYLPLQNNFAFTLELFPSLAARGGGLMGGGGRSVGR